MTRVEIKNLILRRAYIGAFEEGIDDTFNLHTFAQENGINNDEAWKAYQELEDSGLIRTFAGGGVIINTPHGLLRAEQFGLIDRAQIDKQEKIRTKLLEALADLRERATHGEVTSWETLICQAGVSVQDFQNNDNILQDFGFVETETGREYEITITGKRLVEDYRKCKRRAEDFERLEKLEGVTKQERGHRLEDLLADSAEWEDWEVTRRPRAQGTENDIIIHTGLHYFLCSCKWEAEPVMAEVAELLECRARRRPPANGGILFSMSGFTPNCIEEMRMMIATALIVPFGPADIKLIMYNGAKMKDLLFEKIDQVMTHRQYLIDGKNI